jgi:phosphohistidine phosphatase
MKLYIIRHGDALLPTINPERPLSDRGVAQVKQLAERLQAQQVKPHYIYHSGILRAKQTAKILAESLHVAAEKLAGLLPDDAPEPMLAQIATWVEDTMLVGHLPYVLELADSLCVEGCRIEFTTATAVCLERNGQHWKIQQVIKNC